MLYNTCSVRQHAEDKIYSALGRIKRLKELTADCPSVCWGAWHRKTRNKSSGQRLHVDVVVGPGPARTSG